MAEVAGPPPDAEGIALMYGWIWRNLPGGTAIKAVEALVLVAVVLVLLWMYVFPWVEHTLPLNAVTV